MLPASFCKTGSTTFFTSLQLAAAEIITVPGAITSESLYFCFIERESFPVGILIPRSMAKSETAFTASYRRASSPSLLHGHIQLADKLTLFRLFCSAAHTIVVKASGIAILEPAVASISATNGACPIDVATPSVPEKSSAITPQLFKGSCNCPAVCCFATLPVTQRSTLLVSQSLL